MIDRPKEKRTHIADRLENIFYAWSPRRKDHSAEPETYSGILFFVTNRLQHRFHLVTCYLFWMDAFVQEKHWQSAPETKTTHPPHYHRPDEKLETFFCNLIKRVARKKNLTSFSAGWLNGYFWNSESKIRK